MDDPAGPWQHATHDWAVTVDAGHLADIRLDPARFAPGGVRQLILEVAAYAADEAEVGSGSHCVITFCRDGSLSVSDNGRGTDTRRDSHGRIIKKPVMPTRDLRFFDSPGAHLLPGGYPRRGLSVVAALSEWLVHTNRRHDGAWTQRYEHGIPATGLIPIPATRTTGTTVHFRPSQALRATSPHPGIDTAQLAAWWPHLRVQILHEAGS